MSVQSDVTESATEARVDGSKLGMWLFLATELILFGGLFILYASYRFEYPALFQTGSNELNLTLGTINTVVLITSSLFVALSILALEKERVRLSRLFLALTIFMGLAFMVIKGFEWGEKFRHGLYPNAEHLLSMEEGEILFFGLYYTMTGLHALHVLIGVGVLSGLLLFHFRGTLTRDRIALLENGGLYWHLVDIIWIFLFPLFYLIG
jgi:cytochrome c oxidase subunit 3